MAEKPNSQDGQQVGLQPGARVGKYEVVERIAIGGQAIVYKCRDEVLDRFVALKQISSHLAEDPKFLQRFRNEAQILAKLSARQPGIVSIHDILEEPQGLFIVMEFVDGQTIEEILRITNGPIEAKPVLRILWKLAGAMHDVHQAGYLHRDLKPENILVQEGIRPKITDFGVAASRSGQTSMVLGTTKYMAPELFGSEEVDGRCDIYSLGMIAYEMLVGRPQFREIFSDVVRDPHSEALRWMKWHGNCDAVAPRLDTVLPDVPTKLADIIEKMLAKDPDQRFDSMEELGRAIKQGFAPRRAGAAGIAAQEQVDLEETDISPALPVEDDDSEEVYEPPATAPLKRKRLSGRTRIVLGILAALLVLGGIGTLLVIRAQERQARARQALDLFQRGMELYEKQQYAQASESFARAAGEYARTDAGRKSKVMEAMAKAWLAVEENQWGQAGNYQQEALDAVAAVNRAASEGSDLHQWARKQEEKVRSFRQEQLMVRSFRETMDQARRLLAEERFDQARQALASISQQSMTPEQRQAHFDLRRRVQQEALVHEVQTALDQARSARQQAQEGMNRQRYPEAIQALDQALQRLEGAWTQVQDDAAQPMAESLLEPQQQASFLEEFRQVDSQLTTLVRFARSMQQALQARQEGNASQELVHLNEARKIRQDPRIDQRIEQLELDMLRDEGLRLAQEGPAAQAIQVLRDYLKQRTDDAAAGQALDDLLADQKWQAMVQAGKEAVANENYTGALEHFLKAAKIRQNDDLAQRIARVRFNLHWENALAAIEQGDYEEAEKQLASCAQHAPDQAGKIDAMKSMVDRLQRYRIHMQAGTQALQQAQYVKAREAYRKAQEEAKLLEDESKLTEAAKGYSEAFYLEQMTKGKQSFQEEDYTAAGAFFILARDEAPTAQQRKDAQEWVDRAQAARNQEGG